MTDSTRLLTALRNELETAGLIRRPNAAGVLPPCHIEPKDGPVAPGSRDAPESTGILVVSLELAGELAEGAYDSYRRRASIAVTYRSTGTDGLKAGRVLDDAIRTRIVRRADYGVGYVLDVAGSSPTQVLQASVFGGIGPVSEQAGVRTERATYLLEVLA